MACCCDHRLELFEDAAYCPFIMAGSAELHRLHQRCRDGDAGLLPALLPRLCVEGFQWHMDNTTRRWRWVASVVYGSFVFLAVCVLLLLRAAHGIPSIECFLGMIGWAIIYYGGSGLVLLKRLESDNRLREGRNAGWQAMIGALMLMASRFVDLHITLAISQLINRLIRLRACWRVRLGLIDPNLIAFRLVPPESAHA